MLDPQSPIPKTTARGGFTLIELLISVGLLSLLLVLMGQLFQQSSTAVSTSTRTSAVLASTRSVASQMQDDFASMMGPDSTADEVAGFLVIVNQIIPDVAFPEPRNGGEYAAPIRSDHIAFYRTVQGLTPMSPRNDDTYGNSIDTATHARITYGTATRTNRDGSPTAGPNNGIGQANAGLDRLATELILGRQALMIVPTPGATPGTNEVDTAVDWHATTIQVTASITNVTGYPGTPRLYNGVSPVTLRDPIELSNRLRDADMGLGGWGGPTYTTGILRNMTFVDNRLQVNPAPTDGDLDAWQIGQTHGIFAPNCSEFVVQFAGDLDNDGELDLDDNGTPVNGTDDFIIWYDAFNGNLPATPWNGMDLASDTYIPGASATDPHLFVFRMGDDGSLTPADPGNSKWPMLIRIRYRLHDARGRITSNDPAALGDGIDNDGDGAPDEEGEDQISGRWFEHIYRVPRPELPTTP